ncbi:MAG TPA: hypothetical protein VF402_06970, partial [Asticcacaulis sp.]
PCPAARFLKGALLRQKSCIILALGRQARNGACRIFRARALYVAEIKDFPLYFQTLKLLRRLARAGCAEIFPLGKKLCLSILRVQRTDKSAVIQGDFA